MKAEDQIVLGIAHALRGAMLGWADDPSNPAIDREPVASDESNWDALAEAVFHGDKQGLPKRLAAALLSAETYGNTTWHELDKGKQGEWLERATLIIRDLGIVKAPAFRS